HHGALSLTRGFECIDKRQRNLALAQVAANRLAQGLLERRKVQHVVDELESHDEIPGEIPEAFFELRLRAARHRAEFGAGGKQAGRLAVHQLHAIGFRDADLADAVELDEFAFHHELREADQKIQNMEIALPQRRLKRLHVQPVARQNTGVIAPLHVGRRPAAASTGNIDHVVMDERGGMDHFDDSAELDSGFAVGRGVSRAREPGAKQEQGRAEALSAALLEIPADGGDGLDGRKRLDVDGLFDLFQIFADEIENLAGRQSLVCPFSFHGTFQCSGSDYAAANKGVRSWWLSAPRYAPASSAALPPAFSGFPSSWPVRCVSRDKEQAPEKAHRFRSKDDLPA